MDNIPLIISLYPFSDYWPNFFFVNVKEIVTHYFWSIYEPKSHVDQPLLFSLDEVYIYFVVCLFL